MNIHHFPHSQSSLRTLNGRVDPQRERLEAAAEQFEALFLQQILKQMRKAGDVLSADNPMRSRDLDTMRDLYDQVLADSMSAQGQTGIRDMLVQQLTGDQGGDAVHTGQMHAAPLPKSSGGAFQPVVQAWRQGVDQLTNAWERGSAAFQNLVASVVKHESGGQVDAVSPRGARGVMQLMPGTAQDMAAQLGIPYSETRLLYDSEYNKRLGSAYLTNMLERYEGSEALALAAYNAGPGRVDEWLKTLGDPRSKQISEAEWVEKIPYSETRNYTRSILQDIRAAAAPNLQTGQFNNVPGVVAFREHGVTTAHAGEAMRQSPAFAQLVRIETKEPAS